MALEILSLSETTVIIANSMENAGFRIREERIYGPDCYTGFRIREARVYGPDGYTGFYLREDRIYGPDGNTHFSIREARIYGPYPTMPWGTDA